MIQNIVWTLPILLESDTQRVEEIIRGLENSPYTDTISDGLTSTGWNIFYYVWSSIVEKICNWLLLIFTVLLRLVETVEDIFNIYTGMNPITDTATGKQYSLLSWLMNQGAISRAVLYITVMAGVLAFLFAIAATARSITDSALGDERYPLSRVLGSSMRCLATFAAVPFFCLFLSELSIVILRQLLTAFLYANGSSEQTSVSDMIFLAAVRGSEKYENSFSLFSQYPGAYKERELVKKAFDITKIDWLVGFLCALVLLFILAAAILMFVRRAFEILALYLVAPLFASTIPLDSGKKFSAWREMFIGRFFSGYGTILAMQFYMIFVPELVSGSDLRLAKNEIQNGLMSVLFVIVGAWAVYKGQQMIEHILCPDSSAEESMNLLAMYFGGKALKKLSQSLRGGNGRNSQGPGNDAPDSQSDAGESGGYGGQRFGG